MGEPLRKDDLHEPPQNPPGGQPAAGQFNVHRFGSPHRSGGRYWWFWILVIAVVVWFIVWGRGNGHRAANIAVPVPASVPVPQNTVGVASLLANPQQYLGKRIHLRDVLVDSVNGNASIFVGPGNAQQVLVILQKGSVPESLQGKPNAIPQGGVLDVAGTVEKAGSASDLEHTAKITHKQAEAVAQQGIVIEADRADPQPI